MSDAIRGSRIKDIENPRCRPSLSPNRRHPNTAYLWWGGAREGSTNGDDCLICFVVLNVCVIYLVVYIRSMVFSIMASRLENV
jgi:hypothetical protein